MNQGITLVIIGNEILSGRRQDCHFANTLAACKARDIPIKRVHYLGDDHDQLCELFTQTLHNKETVLSFGGIGATPDDRTRAAMAQACGVPLTLHDEGMAILDEKFAGTVSDERKRLVTFPQGAQLIPNPINRIPGFYIHEHYCVPGFPQMAQPMIEWVLAHRLSALVDKRVYHSFHAFLAESEAIAMLELLEAQFPELSISCLPQLHHELEIGFDGEQSLVLQAQAAAQQWLRAHHYNFKP
ncbi:competence/damage-inducible protein A [Suttonella sp. R2A3]|uniref:competence/damage-inducible protein A n=1 Tax=Suttonella sp. R2A3 TaxID=2908648 RepID=UPI001F2C35EF|nr:competence/damage-inducible protein A [Suttonella sp. R2A3]UJF23962.1 competence/damage-inducible protein A [Suttonella sp. R2A3]